MEASSLSNLEKSDEEIWLSGTVSRQKYGFYSWQDILAGCQFVADSLNLLSSDSNSNCGLRLELPVTVLLKSLILSMIDSMAEASNLLEITLTIFYISLFIIKLS